MIAIMKEDSRCSAKFTLEFDLNKQIDLTKIVAESLKPEIKDDVKRSEIKIRNEKNRIILDITAKDVSALRAAINSNLRLLCCAADVFEKITKNSPM
jgi:tRNA threonylcarbamoyladenosine modification (KEOPS) complex  Pcc1 subunit